MAESNDLNTQIQNTGTNPASVETDKLKVTAQKLPDLIQADRYLKASAAAGLPGLGLRFVKLIGPPQCPAQPVPGDLSSNDGSYQ